MHQPENTSAKTPPIDSDRCRLVFYGDASQNLPQEVVLERLRRLLKDSPEKFQRRMARLPLVLLPQTDRSTAGRYQQMLAQKGIACCIETIDSVLPGTSPLPREVPGNAASRPPGVNPAASSLSPPRDPVSGGNTKLGSMARLGMAICFNPRGAIGRVLSTAPYRLTLILAAGVGLIQAAGAVLDGSPGGALSALLKVLAVFILAPLIGIFLVYVRGFLIHCAGRFLHGQAQPREVRTALAWSEIPLLLGGGVGILQVVMGGLGIAASGRAADHSFPVMLSQTGLGMLHAAVGIWAFSLLLHTVAEIQGFSLCRSFASIVLAAAIVVIPLAVVGGVVLGPGVLTLGK